MEKDRLLKLYENVARARSIEVELSDLKNQEVSLQKQIEELERAVKPKKRFFLFAKKEQDDYEMGQAKVRYDMAVQDISHIQELIGVKSGELSSLQDAKEEFTKIFEEKLAFVRDSGKRMEELKTLETSYLINLKRKELLQEAKEKAWMIQYQIQNIIIILKQAVEAYNADAKGSFSTYGRFERIDKAKEETEKLEQMLGEFQNMLNEMELKFEMQVDSKNFVSYASEGNESFWTDSRILTLQVRERIKEILEEFEEKEVQADNFRKELTSMEKSALRELYESQKQLEDFVMFRLDL